MCWVRECSLESDKKFKSDKGYTEKHKLLDLHSFTPWLSHLNFQQKKKKKTFNVYCPFLPRHDHSTDGSSFKMGLPFPDIFGCETSFMWLKLLYVKLRRKELQPLSL